MFTSGCRNIAFGVNVEGFNTDGFAGMIAGRYWPALANTGTRTMGQVLTHRAGQYTFHALVCHRIDIGGFHQTPRVITECLNAIAVPDDTEIACVMVGGGPMGQAAGADTNAILEGIARSSKRVAVYSL
ncbi:MAG TPA: hypothetical protein VJM46_00670 [Candidatus Saccharimonadales bacterium]|nr:hypothetical protein [Candidatus Saccharimonadales bacterium]